MKSTTGGQADSRNNGPALMQLPSAHRKRHRNGVPLSNVTVPYIARPVVRPNCTYWSKSSSRVSTVAGK